MLAILGVNVPRYGEVRRRKIIRHRKRKMCEWRMCHAFKVQTHRFKRSLSSNENDPRGSYHHLYFNSTSVVSLHFELAHMPCIIKSFKHTWNRYTLCNVPCGWPQAIYRVSTFKEPIQPTDVPSQHHLLPPQCVSPVCPTSSLSPTSPPPSHTPAPVPPVPSGRPAHDWNRSQLQL